MEKISLQVKVLALISLAVFFVQPFMTWFISDDYCLMASIQAEGLLRNMFYDYLNWDGRSISLTYPVCRAGLFFGVTWLGPLLGCVLMVILAALMLRIVSENRQSGVHGILRTVTLTVLLWLVFFNFLAQTLYWTTGVGYNMDVVMLLMAIYWINRWKGQPLDFLVGLPVFFYAGTCSPNGVLALLFVIVVQWLYKNYIQKSRSHVRYVYALVLIIAAMSFVVFSPGNKNRMTAWDWNNLTHIWTVYFNVKLLLRNLFQYNSLFIWPLIAVGALGATLKLSSAKKRISGIVTVVLNFLFEHRFLIAAVISFFFFLPLPGLNSPRTAIQFAAFATLYGLSHLPFLLDKLGERKAVLLTFFSIAINLIFIATASSQAFDARYVKIKLEQRDAMLKELKGKDVVLTEEHYVRTPATRRFEDLASDSAYWLNQCIATHYGLKSIKMVDSRPKKVVTGMFTD
jgi:hypothetical protein